MKLTDAFADLPERLLDWYDQHARDLPWRIGPAARARGVKPDPYRVWLAEIMLQQTTVTHASKYYQNFTGRWPTVEALAAARDEDVMAAWAGLGYYARARNLLKCARRVAADGQFPETAKSLQELPGIGPYTSGAIAALAFGARAAAVDGNVERVFARLCALKRPMKDEKPFIRRTVQGLVPGDRPAEFAEALMDLGATICTPKRPNCLICPLTDMCAARAEGDPEIYPIKAAKTAKPTRAGHVYLLVHGSDILLERRPETGLLGGMLALPGSDWTESPPAPGAGAPAPAEWSPIGIVTHVFTHFALTLQVAQAEISGPRPEGLWTAIDAVDGLPSVFKKAFKLLQSAGPAA
ncbi:MAG: A/G-specific adenine glycosylase [Pseudomonadota bacterium]